MLSHSNINQLKKIFTEADNVLLVFMIGSVLHGEQHEESDVDVAVLFKIKPGYDERLELINKIEDIFNQEVDLGILNDASPVFRYQVISKGKLIYMKDSKARDYFVLKTLNEYSDLSYYRSIQEKTILKGRIFAG
ncbi:MAG: nucleotidyltransferase domain-containing protein [Calditrichaceae bacterium]